MLPEDLIHTSYRWVLAKHEETVVGFASFRNDHSDAVIADVAVDKTYQGQGIATRLIEQCVFEIKTLWIESIECYAWMTNGYPHLEKPLLRCGFEKIKVEHRLPKDHRDNFKCPVCGSGCSCDTMVFRIKTNIC